MQADVHAGAQQHFLVVADFPSGFSDTAVRRLMSIAASGARCGVFTLIHWDTRVQAVADLVPDDLRKKAKDRDQIVAGFANFRKTLTK